MNIWTSLICHLIEPPFRRSTCVVWHCHVGTFSMCAVHTHSASISGNRTRGLHKLYSFTSPSRCYATALPPIKCDINALNQIMKVCEMDPFLETIKYSTV